MLNTVKHVDISAELKPLMLLITVNPHLHQMLSCVDGVCSIGFLFALKRGYETCPCSRGALFARPTVVPTQIATLWKGQITSRREPRDFITTLHIEIRNQAHRCFANCSRETQNIHFPDIIERNICCSSPLYINPYLDPHQLAPGS